MADAEKDFPEALVCFAHGKESGPWGTKITHLAQTARRRGFDVISPDYSHTHDPHMRVAHLLALAPKARRALVLVGSSMGGYVSAMAAEILRPSALFLMAPALYFPGFDEEPKGIPEETEVIHGWRDDIVPPDRSVRFAQRNGAALHLLPSDHGLNDQLEVLDRLLDDLLRRTLQKVGRAATAPEPVPSPLIAPPEPITTSRLKTPRTPLSGSRREALNEAYRRVEYRVTLDSGLLAMRIDQFDATADRLLRDSGVQRNWAILTPCNPRSEQVREESNRLYQDDLRQVIDDNHITWHKALNRDPDGYWPDEPGVLLCDPEPGLAEALGRRFQQNAIVTGVLGQAPSLVWLD